MNVESQIVMLNHQTDEPTKQMLQNLVDRKRKFDKFKQKCFFYQMFTFITLIGFMAYLYRFVVQPSGGNIGYVFSSFVNETLHTFLVLTIVGGYATSLYFKKKEDKAETEYHNLRCEIIKKSPALWPQPFHWQKRNEVFKVMKKEFDINLFHESK